MRNQKNNNQPEQPELFPGLLESLSQQEPIAEEDLIGKGALARERRKNKNRLAAPESDREPPGDAANDERKTKARKLLPNAPEIIAWLEAHLEEIRKNGLPSRDS